MKQLSQVYPFKEDPVSKKKWEAPVKYLGANIGRYSVPGDAQKDHHWFMSSDGYVKAAVRAVEDKLAKCDKVLCSKVHSPMSSGYRTELDVSAELNADQTQYYQELIGVLRWAIELGRVDIHVNVALLSQYLANPRAGHMDQVLRIFAYLKKHDRSKLVFDDTPVAWDESCFNPAEWEDFYPGAKENLPPDPPEPRGNPVQTNCFVDANHAGDQVTRRSHTGILIYLNTALVSWFSKRQNTVESASFGSEFIALKIAVEQIHALRYKLRMMGIPLDGETNVFCDNQAVVINSSFPESQLKKKHLSICYHIV